MRIRRIDKHDDWCVQAGVDIARAGETKERLLTPFLFNLVYKGARTRVLLFERYSFCLRLHARDSNQRLLTPFWTPFCYTQVMNSICTFLYLTRRYVGICLDIRENCFLKWEMRRSVLQLYDQKLSQILYQGLVLSLSTVTRKNNFRVTVFCLSKLEFRRTRIQTKVFS